MTIKKSFQQIVLESLSSIPDVFKEKLDNVAITIQEWPSDEDLKSAKLLPGTTLYGLYRGIPKTKRNINYSSLPDKIIIFEGPILEQNHDENTVKKEIRKTILHEIGHHFGLNEEEIAKAFKDK